MTFGAQLHLLAAALLILSIAHGLSGATIPTTATSKIPISTPGFCVKGGKLFMLGESYKPTPCEECRCETLGGPMSCIISDCFFVACVDSVHDPTKCCRQCPNGHNCKHSPSGVIIKQGGWFAPDPNTFCECPQNLWGMRGVEAICVPRVMESVRPSPTWTTVAA